MGNLKKQTFPVLNMHCAGCANNVEKTVRKLVGVADASVNFASNTLSVSYETDKLTPVLPYWLRAMTSSWRKSMLKNARKKNNRNAITA